MIQTPINHRLATPLFLIAALAAAACLALAPAARALESEAGTLTVSEVASGLDEPWSVGFLPSGDILVTERGGTLWNIRDGEKLRVLGLGNVWSQGQGGLLDVLVPDNFERTRALFFSFSKPQPGGAGTAVARAELSPDGKRLSKWRVIFEMEPGSEGGRHFGSRLVEARDGTLFVTIGDRGDRPSAQDLTRENGSVIRIDKDGGIPPDNPFRTDPGAQPEIWSYGHRNPQGATLDLEGNLIVIEHGARGGDEVNLVERGANYGWPIISYGTHYSGAPIGEGTEKPGMKQPALYWDPSIAPSGAMVYSGALWPEWKGDIFTGSLKFGFLSRIDGATMQEAERIEGPETARLRDVREGPDGAIWLLSVGQGALYRVTP